VTFSGGLRGSGEGAGVGARAAAALANEGLRFEIGIRSHQVLNGGASNAASSTRNSWRIVSSVAEALGVLGQA